MIVEHLGAARVGPVRMRIIAAPRGQRGEVVEQLICDVATAQAEFPAMWDRADAHEQAYLLFDHPDDVDPW